MDALYPTVTIGSPDQHWKLWEMTVNPMLWLPDNAPFFSTDTTPRYEVWVELVLVHEQATEQELPRVTFAFNDAFDFGDESPPEQDTLHGHQAVSINQIYYEYWHLLPHNSEVGHNAESERVRAGESLNRDPLVGAYGRGARRVLRQEHAEVLRGLAAERRWRQSITDSVEYTDACKGGLAFLRSRYAEPGDHVRRCYPCRWTARSSTRGSGDHVVTLGGLSLHECDPNLSFGRQQFRSRISREECISLWYWFPYAGSTGRRASTPEHGLYSFVLRTEVEEGLLLQAPPVAAVIAAAESPLCATPAHPPERDARGAAPCSVNIFPRVAAEFDLSEACDPPIQPVPRLDIEPKVWQRDGKSLTRPYRCPRTKQDWVRITPPTNGGATVRSLRIHCEMIDRYHASGAALVGFICGVALAVAINILSPDGVKLVWGWVGPSPVVSPNESAPASNDLPAWVVLGSLLLCVVLAVIMHYTFFPGRGGFAWQGRLIRDAWSRLKQYG